MSRKIRTLSDLQTALADEFAWRKKELIGLKGIVAANENNYKRDLSIRAAITILYAHWEGFIKNVGTDYLEYVSRQQLKYSELGAAFVATAIGKRVRSITGNSRIQPCLDAVSFFQNEMETKCVLPGASAINTKSNLSSEVLREIVATLGLDYSRFLTKEKLIDEKLLHNRNNIAHGRFLIVTFPEYVVLHDEILALMQEFYNQVENAAHMGLYRAAPPGQQNSATQR
jgi:hypothetical protein